MVKFADKGRPLKPGSRIGMCVIIYSAGLVIFYMTELLFGVRFFHPVSQILFLMAVITVGALLSVRLVLADWREAALASMFVTLAFTAMQAEGANQLLFMWPAANAGLFLLPLTDPVTRKDGPSPSLAKLIPAGALFSLLALGADYFHLAGMSGRPFFGLGTLLIGSGAAWILVSAGLILLVFKKTLWSAYSGGIGITVLLFSLTAWYALGLPWFP